MNFFTQSLYKEKLTRSKLAVWNGPLGIVEIPDFKAGSRAVADSLVAGDAKILVGGGEIVSFLSREGLLDKIGYVSTGGGAMLAFLAGETLPGIEALKTDE